MFDAGIDFCWYPKSSISSQLGANERFMRKIRHEDEVFGTFELVSLALRGLKVERGSSRWEKVFLS
jgi:hypothetical protein